MSCLIAVPGDRAWAPCLVTSPGYLARLPCPVTLPRSLSRSPCLVTMHGYHTLRFFMDWTFVASVDSPHFWRQWHRAADLAPSAHRTDHRFPLDRVLLGISRQIYSRSCVCELPIGSVCRVGWRIMCTKLAHVSWVVSALCGSPSTYLTAAGEGLDALRFRALSRPRYGSYSTTYHRYDLFVRWGERTTRSRKWFDTHNVYETNINNP